MKYEDHIKRCETQLGSPYPEVHQFLDQFWQKYQATHRRLLHHQLGIQLIVNRFGEDVRKAAELHIMDDMGFLPNTWLDHDPYTFFLSEKEETDQKRDLILLFGEEKVLKLESHSNSENDTE